jgi:ElaB/YqjD/DUF883 family membrane-anchored ribosome-binding protein
MDTLGSPNNLAKQGQDLADTAAEKIQSGIRNVKDTGSHAADRLSDKVESVRSSAGPAIGKAANQTESLLSQTVDSLSLAGKKVRSTVSDVGDSVVTYTKDNPVKAILMSAAAGVLIATIVRAFNRE